MYIWEILTTLANWKKSKKVNLDCNDLEKINKDKESNIQLTFKEELHLLIMCLLPKYENKTELLIEIKEILKKEKYIRKEKIDVMKCIIGLEIDNLISKEDQELFKGDEDMNQELEEKMMKVAKEVNKKYEQIALEEAKKEGIQEGKMEIKIEMAKKLKELLTPEKTAEITGLKIEEIRLL